MKDDIIRMAREAGFATSWTEAAGEALERFAQLIRADEREACAKVCEEHPDGLNMMGGAFVTCANAIRARGNK
jgi:hypothetical protein